MTTQLTPEPPRLARMPVPDDAVNAALNLLILKLNKRLDQHGRGTYASRHEVLGILAEEYHEFVEAVQGNDMQEFEDEALDVAVACVFGVACRQAGLLGW